MSRASLGLDSIERFCDGAVIRILGLNPGPFTLDGSNTYLVGRGRRRLLIDTADGTKPAYFDLILDALGGGEDDEHGTSATITDIVITHWHRDHIGGVERLAAMFPDAKFHKYSHENDAGLLAFDSVRRHVLSSESVLVVQDDDSPADTITVQVVPTPGHTDDHIALFSPELSAVFTGDCILGTGSTIFTDLDSYLVSLHRLRDLNASMLFPGHGPVIVGQENVRAVIESNISHRMNRERQILELLSRNGTLTLAEMLSELYSSISETRVRMAAGWGISLHLERLLKGGRVTIVAHGDSDGSTSDETTTFEQSLRNKDVSALSTISWALVSM